MSKMSIQEKLEGLNGIRKKVRLTRRFPDAHNLYGFILGLSRKWVLIHQVVDAGFDGYSILRVSDVTKVRSGKYERFWEQMLRGEGLLDLVGISYEIDLKSTFRILESLRNVNKFVIIECENATDSEKDEFYIGHIVKVDRKHLWFVCFDAVGEWEEEGVVIPLDEITRIQIDTPYANLYSKYVPAFRQRDDD